MWDMIVSSTAWSRCENKTEQHIILQGINMSHLGKRKIIFKMPFFGDMLVSWRVFLLTEIPARRKKYTEANWDFLCSYWSIGSADVLKDIMI